MTHRYNIRKTKHDPSTGLITKITFSLVTEEGDNYWHTKIETPVVGTAADEGFIPFNDLTQADLENIIDKYEVKSQIETINSASLATHIESLVYSDDLPPNLQ